jgi:hypothetical protein
MNVIPIQNVWFDDAATFAMGEAFDNACKSLRNFGSACTVREIIAKRIISVAKNGERDPTRLHEQALKALGIKDTSMLVVSVGRDLPVPAYASITRPSRALPLFSGAYSNCRPLGI